MTKFDKYLALYRFSPDALAVQMMRSPKVLAEVVGAFAGAEGEGGYFMRQDATQVVSGTAVTVDGQPLSEIWADLQARLAAFNTQMSLLISLLSFPVDRAQERVGIYQTPSFEEATELGRPQKIRLQYVNRGFPLKHFDLGFGYTQEFVDSARGAEITATAAQAESAYWTLILETILLAIFSENNSTDDDGVLVRRLYNADGEVPPSYKRWGHDGTHTHYLTTAGAALADADILALQEHLLHHGYGDFGERFILHANLADIPAIQALTGFVPATTATVPVIIDGNVVGTQRQGIPGLPTEGYIQRFVVVENNDLPSGYLFAHATGGQFATQNVAGVRRHENPSARGMRLVEGPVARYPLIDAVYDCYTGAGIRHRGGAAVMQITAGAYADPTF